MKKLILIISLVLPFWANAQDYRVIDWKTDVLNVQTVGVDTFKFDAEPKDYNDAGAITREIGNYFIDFVARCFKIIDSDATTITVVDLEHINMAPQSNQIGRVYQSVVDADSLFESIGGVDISVLDQMSIYRDVARNNEIICRLLKELYLKDATYRQKTDHDSLSMLDEKSYNSLTDKPNLTIYRQKSDHDSLSALDEKSYNSLTDKPASLPASDVYPWAKAATKPTYTKSEVGLSNVDNTSDANKPISTATQTALNAKLAISDTTNKWQPKGTYLTSYTETDPTVSALVKSIDATDTTYWGRAETDPTVSAWAKAATKPTYTKSEVGLSNVDNTSDANKPISTATQTALNAKLAISDTTNKWQPKGTYLTSYTETDPTVSALVKSIDATDTTYWGRAETDPTVSAWAKAATKPTYTKSEVGLSNVDNTSDASKPISTATQTALNAKLAISDTTNKWQPKGTYLTSFTETDPTVSALVKSIDANDTTYWGRAETDPTVSAWAKAATKPTYTKSEVGLSNVDNTSDASKPISTATQTALNNLVPFSGADRDVDLGANSISTDTVKIDGVPLLLNTFKQGNLGGASNIFYSTGASSQPASGTVNQVIGGNSLSANYVPKWDGSKFANSNIYQDGTGNVGIGTTNPAQLLNIVNPSGAANIQLERNFTGTTGINGIGSFLIKNSGNGDIAYFGLRKNATSSDFVLSIYDGSATAWRQFIYFHLGTRKYEVQDGVADVEFKNTGNLMLNNGGNVGIGTSTPAAQIHSQSTGTQARLGYDANKYTDLTTTSAGTFNISPSGGFTNFSGGITATGYSSFTGQVELTGTDVNFGASTILRKNGSDIFTAPITMGACGSAGQVLSSTGPNSAPIWTTPATGSGSGITSIGMQVPTGLTVSPASLTANGTFTLGLQSGYSIPTTANQTNWSTAYTNRITSVSASYPMYLSLTNNVLTGYLHQRLVDFANANQSVGYLYWNGSAYSYQAATTTYTLPTASSTTLGGVQISQTDGGLAMSGNYLLQKDNVLTDRTPELTDYIAFYDNSATAQGKMTLSTLGSLIGGSGGGMVYPGAGIPVSTGSAWGTSKTAPSGAIVGTTDSQALTNKSINGVTLSTGAGATNFLAGDGTYKAVSGSSKWTSDTYGINYQSGNVGIGSVSASSAHLTSGSFTSSTIVGIVGLSNSEIGISGASNTNIGVRGTSGSSFGGDFTGLGCRATKFYVSSLNTAPASSTATGTTGEIRFTSDYIYVCVATNTWKRTQISTW